MKNNKKEGKKNKDKNINNQEKTNIIKDKKKIYKEKLQKREKRINKHKDKGIYENNESIILDKHNKNLNIEVTSKNKKRINRAKVITVFILIIAVIIYISASVYNLIINPTDTVVVKEGRISSEETVIGYIIREETVIKGDNYKNGI